MRTGRAESTYRSEESGPLLFLRTWTAQPCRIALGVVHGLGEHGDRYRYLQESLVPEGISVFAPDLRGHGRSEGARGVIRSFDEYVADVVGLRNVMKEAVPDRPHFLLGHSMGALVLLNHLLEDGEEGLSGAIISAPPFEVGMPIPRWKDVAGRLLSRVLPEMALKSGIDPAAISTLDEEIARYEEDPHVHPMAASRLYTEILRVRDRTAEEAGRLRLPIFSYHGKKDPIARAEGTRTFHETLNSEKKRLKIYENSRHEVVNDRERDKLFQDLIAWMNEVSG